MSCSQIMILWGMPKQFFTVTAQYINQTFQLLYTMLKILCWSCMNSTFIQENEMKETGNEARKPNRNILLISQSTQTRFFTWLKNAILHTVLSSTNKMFQWHSAYVPLIYLLKLEVRCWIQLWKNSSLAGGS